MTGIEATREEFMWLRDTLTRISLRYGRALHALSQVPGPLALAHLWSDPYATDVQDAADAIAATVQTAMAELGRIEDYVNAITDPGPARCKVCGADIAVFRGSESWQHYRTVFFEFPGRPETFEVDHDPAPIWDTPERPDWRTDDTDLTADQHGRQDTPQDSEDPGATRHQASAPGSLRKEHHPS